MSNGNGEPAGLENLIQCLESWRFASVRSGLQRIVRCSSTDYYVLLPPLQSVASKAILFFAVRC